MKTRGIFAGIGIWFIVVLLVIFSSYFPNLQSKFLNLAKPHILLGLIIAIAYSVHSPSRSILPRPGERIVKTKLTLLYCVATLIITQIVYLFTVVLLPRDILDEQMRIITVLLPGNAAELIIHIVLTWVLFVPVEEMVFRGLIHRFISETLGKRTSLIISSTLFATAHFNIIQIPIAFVVGIMTADILDKTGKITNSVIVHAFNNTVSLIISFII